MSAPLFILPDSQPGAIDMRILILPASIALALFLTAGTSAAPVTKNTLTAFGQPKEADSVTLVQKKWPGTRKKKGKKDGKGKGKKGRKAQAGGSSGKGKCPRLAEKHGLPASECRALKGEKKCQQLARKHGLSPQECKSL